MEPRGFRGSDSGTGAVRVNGGIRVVDAVACPLCESAGKVVYDGLVDRSWDAPGIWSCRQCRTCGHLWLDPRPLDDEIARLYVSYYTHGVERPFPLEGDRFWPRCRRGVLEAFGYLGTARDSTELFLGRAMRFVPPIREECEEIVHSVPGPPHGRLLDIGCGDGAFLRLMRGLGWTVHGVEPDPKAASVARVQGIDVIESPIERARLPADAFDAITMSHVIEHAPDPIAVFVAARRALKPGGTLFLFTPNAESWGHAMFGRAWYPLEPPRHLHVFRSKNLMMCAERAGLQVVRVLTTGRLHLIFDASVSIRRRGRFRFDDPAVRASVPERFFRVFENLLVRVRPNAGEEIVMLCTKRNAG